VPLTLAILTADQPKGKTLVLGTMRFLDVERTTVEWREFLRSAYNLGYQTLHSSSEYESFPLLSGLLSNSGDIRFRHVVKLAEPSFDDEDFDAGRLEQKVHDYCRSLSTPVIHDVQWMWRHSLKDEAARLSQFERRLDAIGDAATRLKTSGLIQRFFCFPYTPGFAAAALAHDAIDGLIVYRNVNETEYDAHIDDCAKLGKTCQIIRPFFGCAEGVPTDISHEEMLTFALNKPAIESAILSSNSVAHLSALMAAVKRF
jgi:hypothetical protein